MTFFEHFIFDLEKIYEMKVAYKLQVGNSLALGQVWGEIIADRTNKKEQKMERRGKVHSQDGQWKGKVDVYKPTLRWEMRPDPAWSKEGEGRMEKTYNG